ncbi:hypothetical protein LO762_28120 [Actinocorallia sp. API 0066]|uniref:Hint domain-containing protein n=1 Tax=Actinocorallia sp. API 0066 TaxID=2896846 RepID=UPI001E571BF0|nr:Hint domain-containing protein [Actinocorallia sp. API 0066]MCD0453019.1 hypothetical protein [Actinocorallia sp. API 0066]
MSAYLDAPFDDIANFAETGGLTGSTTFDPLGNTYRCAGGNWKSCGDLGKNLLSVRGPKPKSQPNNNGNGVSCPVNNSFVPGTLVLMADGSTKPIEDIRVGEKVLAGDVTSGTNTPQTVVATIEGSGKKDLTTLTIDVDGPRGSKTATLTATDNHPFWVPALTAWTDAADLNPGQWLQLSTGTQAQITAITHQTRPTQVHNLTITTTHTYYTLAGPTAVLVHNDGEDGYVTVGRWMRQDEYGKMLRTGMVQPGRGDFTYVVYPASPDAYKPTWKGSIYVEFDVPRSTLIQGGRPGDYKMSGPSTIFSRREVKNGHPALELPKAKNIRLGGGGAC